MGEHKAGEGEWHNEREERKGGREGRCILAVLQSHPETFKCCPD